MRTKQDTLQIVQRLKEEYPLAECTLDYASAWQLLVSVRLAAQCTDARVNIVTEELFAKYPTLEALAAAGADNIEAIVRPCGLGRSKARDLAAMSNMLLNEFGGKVPARRGAQKRQPGARRCVWPTCRGGRHALHPPFEPPGLCERHQRPRKGGKGPGEGAAAGGIERFLPPVRAARARCVHGAQAILRALLPCAALPHGQKSPCGRRVLRGRAV